MHAVALTAICVTDSSGVQEIQERKLEYSAHTKQLNATILHLEEKLAKYLKIEEEFSILELPLGYTQGSFLELITKLNAVKVTMGSWTSAACKCNLVHW